MIDLPFYAHPGTDDSGSAGLGGEAFFNSRPVRLAPDDDFFRKLGIDSLQTLEMLSRLENHFGIELPDYEVQGVSDFKTLAERIQSRL